MTKSDLVEAITHLRAIAAHFGPNTFEEYSEDVLLELPLREGVELAALRHLLKVLLCGIEDGEWPERITN